jgi:hypothetical protein
MADDDQLRERINGALTQYRSRLGDAYDLALRCGLPPFDKLEAAVAPELKRVIPKKRRMFLERLYVVTAQKIMKKVFGVSRQQLTFDLRQRRRQLGRTRAHLKYARKSVSAAQASFPAGLPTRFNFEEVIKRLNDFETDLAERERGMAALVRPDLKTDAEKKIPPPELSGNPLSWSGDKSIVWWFIKALNKCLPRRRNGARSAFSRDKIIQKVLKLSGDTASIRTIMRVRLLRNTTPKGAKSK